jgi:ATP-binding protein involved in chromosome partitioning
MSATEQFADPQAILAAVAEFIEPNAGLSLGDTAAKVQLLSQSPGQSPVLKVQLAYPLGDAGSAVAGQIRDALTPFGAIEVQLHSEIPSSAVQQNLKPVQGIRNFLVGATGTGGVGKSTTAVNLALGLRDLGLKVGVLDADIYGPSVPKLLAIKGKPELLGGTRLKPMEGYGLKVVGERSLAA